jgi:hypothetical protein
LQVSDPSSEDHAGDSDDRRLNANRSRTRSRRRGRRADPASESVTSENRSSVEVVVEANTSLESVTGVEADTADSAVAPAFAASSAADKSTGKDGGETGVRASDATTNEQTGMAGNEADQAELKEGLMGPEGQGTAIQSESPAPWSWGHAANDPRVAPRPPVEGPVLESVLPRPWINELPYISRQLDEQHPSQWSRASNDPRAHLGQAV